MANCLLSMGANIGSPAATVRDAVRVLRSNLALRRFRCSRLFKTPPVGGPVGQPPFVNAVVAFETDLSPWQVWELIRRVEHQFGRQRNERWEARMLDLDILLFDDMRIWTPQLKIPHPRMCMRRFILQPACDVAADWLDPVSNMTVGLLADRLQSRPASLRLVAPATFPGRSILAEVARRARADFQLSGRAGGPLSDNQATRWVGLNSCTNILCEGQGAISRKAEPNLIVFLSPLEDVDNAAWEDQHRELAIRLNLRDDARIPPWDFVGPRYLLASDDQAWVIHELVAALEAMDCPVEALRLDAEAS